MPGAIVRSSSFTDHNGVTRQDGPFVGVAVTIVSTVRADNDIVSMYAIAEDGELQHRRCTFVQLGRLHTVYGMGSPPPKHAWKVTH